MENSAPFEIMSAPFEVWIAPVSTAFPDVDEAPSGSWAKVGTSGNRNINEDGVKVSQAQALSYFRALGSTGKVKAFRSSEDMTVSFKLADMKLEQYTQVMEFQSLTTVAAGAGVAGTKTIGLSRGLTVTRKALLVRGPSPYMDDGVAQYEIPVCVVSSTQEIEGKKDTPCMLALEYEVLEDPSAATENERFGRLKAQTAVATT